MKSIIISLALVVAVALAAPGVPGIDDPPVRYEVPKVSNLPTDGIIVMGTMNLPTCTVEGDFIRYKDPYGKWFTLPMPNFLD